MLCLIHKIKLEEGAMTKQSRNMQEALRYHSLGWSVIPVKQGRKEPLTKRWRKYQKEHSTKKAIKSWWNKWPEANIGIITGTVSKLVVLDADSATAEIFVKDKGILPTPQVRTGKGTHFYLKHPGGRVPNKVNGKIGLDIKGDGGYVVAPPSIHPSGKRYEWAPDSTPWNTELADLPTWVSEYIQNRDNLEQASKNPLGWAVEALAGADEGSRNNMCAKLAGLLVRMKVPDGEARTFLMTWNQRNRPPLDEPEVVQTYESIKAIRERNHPTDSLKPKESEMKIITLGDIHQTQIEFPTPLIDGLLDPCDSLLVTGNAGVGKSLMTLAIAVAVASGQKLFGRFDICQPGPVLLVQSENSLKATKERLGALLQSASNDSERRSYKQALDRIATPIIGQDIRLSGDLINKRFKADLQEMLVCIGAKLLVLDPLISYHRKDENDNVGMRTTLDQLTFLTTEVGAAVLVVHHHGKGHYEGMIQARGATAIVDWARGILTLNRESHPNRLLVTCEHTKHGNFPKATTLLLEVSGPRIFAIEPDVACPPSRVVAALEEMGGEAKSQNQLVLALEQACQISRGIAQKAIVRAKEYGVMKLVPSGQATKVLLASNRDA
jgi:hypothetical protein